MISLFLLLSSVSYAQPPKCGKAQASIEERVLECSKLSGSSKMTKKGVRWDLVARSYDASKNFEVWRDSKTGLVWGDRLDKRYGQAFAVEKECVMDFYEYICHATKEFACGSDDGVKANAGISERTFGLPTMGEFAQATDDGAREVLPNLSHELYWTLSMNIYSDYHAYVFVDGGFLDMGIDFKGDVRCVGR